MYHQQVLRGGPPQTVSNPAPTVVTQASFVSCGTPASFGATSIETPAPVAPPRAAGVCFPPATVVFGDTPATGAAGGHL